MYVVVTGNLSEGFRVFGPFKDFESASEWEEDNPLGLAWSQAWIMTLEQPKDACPIEGYVWTG